MSDGATTRLGFWLDGDATPGRNVEGESIWQAANLFSVHQNLRPYDSSNVAPAYATPAWFIGSATHKPWQNLADEVSARSGLTVRVYPVENGQYAQTDCVISELGYKDEENAIDFLKLHKDDIIAGSIKLASRTNETWPGISEYVVPITLSGITRGMNFGVINRHHAPADGRPPADFRPTRNSHTMKPSVRNNNQSVSPWQKQFGAPMYSPSGYGFQLDQIPFPRAYTQDLSKELSSGAAQWVTGQDLVLIESDVSSIGVDPYRIIPPSGIRFPSMGWQYPRASASFGTSNSFGNAYSIRIAERYVASMKAGVCDIWLRGFHRPWRCWVGGTNLELRLQTDDKGFGYPTTRIYGSYDDPLVSPQESDGEETVVGSGLARTYKGEDGKTRVNVEWPYGIPCLVRVVGNTRIEAGVDRWVYSVRVVHVGYPRTTNDQQLVCSNDVSDQGNSIFTPKCDTSNSAILAYNIAENDNTATFSAPSYKKPSPFPNFRVLPIGENRDGEKQSVCVQAMIYWSGYSHGPIFNGAQPNPSNGNFADVPQIFFCLANAVDGTC